MITMLLAWMSADALAKDDEGITVTLHVTDAATGEPIPTAVARNPQEQDRHPVNAETGTVPLNVFYLPDGTEVLFLKGQTVTFEVSAPGYMNNSFDYVIRRRRNVVEVPLSKMVVDMTEENPDDVMIQFGRDKPID